MPRDYRFIFNPNPIPSRSPKKKSAPHKTDIHQCIDRYDDDDIYEDIFEPDDLNFSDLKAAYKKKSTKALLNGKVLNLKRKKYRKWRKHDRKILKDILSNSLDLLVEDDVISKKKAKKVRKEVTRRILSCFYGKGED